MHHFFAVAPYRLKYCYLLVLLLAYGYSPVEVLPPCILAGALGMILFFSGILRSKFRSKYTATFPVSVKNGWASDESFLQSFVPEGGVFSFKDKSNTLYLLPWSVWSYYAHSMLMIFLFSYAYTVIRSYQELDYILGDFLIASPFLGFGMAMHLFFRYENGLFLSTPHTKVWVERNKINNLPNQGD